MLFVVDNTLGKLRRWMSLLGYNVVYDARSAREILIHHGHYPKDLVVLGRCPGLFEEIARGKLPRGKPSARVVHFDSPVLEEQLRQIAREFPMDFTRTLFSRCTHCNVELDGPLRLEQLRPDADGEPRVPPRVRQWRNCYQQCPQCDQVFWEGTHAERIRAYLRDQVGLAVDGAGTENET